MQTTAAFQVYGVNAYRSELTLFRSEGVTADEAEQVEAPIDARELYRVERSRCPLVITHDASAAFEAFAEGVRAGNQDARFVSLNVMR